MKKFLWFDLYDGVHAYAAINLMGACLLPIISLMNLTINIEAQAMVDNILNQSKKDLDCFSNYLAKTKKTTNIEDMDLSELFGNKQNSNEELDWSKTFEKFDQPQNRRNRKPKDLSNSFNEESRQNQKTMSPKEFFAIAFAIAFSCEIAAVLVFATLAYGTYKKSRGWLLPYLISSGLVIIILFISIFCTIFWTRLYGFTFLFVILAWVIYPWVAVLNLFLVMPKYLDADYRKRHV